VGVRDRSIGARSFLAVVMMLALGAETVAQDPEPSPPVESAAPAGRTEGGAEGLAPPSPSPRPTPMDISTYLTATIAALNIADAPVSVAVDFLDPDSGQVQESGIAIPLGPLDGISQRVLEATYVLTFSGDGRTPVSCTITLAAGAERDFVILADRVLIADPAATSVTGADLDVATSSLCR
jgi:hypothetical protein